MNFYKRFIGDIQRKTGHLTVTEFGAYNRLLDHYYGTGQPLPAELAACYRIVCAMTHTEKKAVESVLAQFFDLTEVGYVQQRVEEMLAEAQAKIKANQFNGQKGGRPAVKNGTQQKPTGLFSETQQEPTGLFLGTQVEPKHNLSQSQSQSQITTSLRSVVGGEAQPSKGGQGSRLPDDWQLPVDWQAWAEQERPDLDARQVALEFADHWHAKPGADARKVDWQATWRNWIRRQHSPRAGPSQSETTYQRSQRERMAQVAPTVARAKPGRLSPDLQVIDVTFTTPEPKRLGHP